MRCVVHAVRLRRRMQYASLISDPRKTRAILFGDNAVRLTVGCGAVSGECNSLRRFWVREERSSAFLVESIQISNRKELEDMFYIQMERLNDSYQMVHQLHQSDERIKRIYAKTPAVQKRAPTPFFKLLQNLVEFGKVFNI